MSVLLYERVTIGVALATLVATANIRIIIATICGRQHPAMDYLGKMIEVSLAALVAIFAAIIVRETIEWTLIPFQGVK